MSRAILEDVLSKKDARELWGLGYRPVLPVTPGDFSMGGVLPAVLYMMRWAQRRGRGKFAERYGKDATIAGVAATLAGPPGLEGFDSAVE